MAQSKTNPATAPGKAANTSNAEKIEKQVPSAKVVQLNANKCTADECKKSPEKAGFCSEHFVWFKEGLITMQGQRARDFDKKYHAWLRRSKSA